MAKKKSSTRKEIRGKRKEIVGKQDKGPTEPNNYQFAKRNWYFFGMAIVTLALAAVLVKVWFKPDQLLDQEQVSEAPKKQEMNYNTNTIDMWQQCADQMKRSKSLTVLRSTSNPSKITYYKTYVFEELNSTHISGDTDSLRKYVHFWIQTGTWLPLLTTGITKLCATQRLAFRGMQSLICQNQDDDMSYLSQSNYHLICKDPMKLLDDFHTHDSCGSHADQHVYMSNVERKKIVENMPEIPNNPACPYNCLCRMAHCFSLIIYCDKSTADTSSGIDRFIEIMTTNEIYIQTLDFSQAKLKDFPSEICTFHALKHLYFSDNQLKVFPYCIQKLHTLVKIDLSFNYLRTFYLTGYFENLKCLQINNNMITKIYFDEDQPTARNLEILNISSNQFENLNFSLPYKLLHLDVSRNHLSAVQSHVFKSLWKLVSLNMAKNNLSKLDRSIFVNNKKLKILDLSYNQLQELSFKIPEQLQNLYLQNNKIEEITHGVFDHATRLKKMILSNNCIKQIDSEITMTNLEELRLDNNQIASLDDISNSFPNLAILDLSKNRIREVDFFARILINSKLQELHLQENKIADISFREILSPLDRLQKLNISFNELQFIPLEVMSINVLVYIDASNNNITTGVWKSKPRNMKYGFEHALKFAAPECVKMIKKQQKFLSQQNSYIHEYQLRFKFQTRRFNATQTRLSLQLAQYEEELMFHVLTNQTDMEPVNTSVEQVVDLQHNNITNMLDILNGIDTSLPENLNLLNFIQFSNNPIVCDCRLYPYLKLVSDIHQQMNNTGVLVHIMAPLTLPECQHPKHLRGLNLSDTFILESVIKQLQCEYEVEISNRNEGSCEYRFLPYNDTLIIDCSYQNLKMIPSILNDTFYHPYHEDLYTKPENKILLLSGNNLTDLNASGISFLDSSTTVDLSHANISSIDDYSLLLLLRKVSYLFLNDNNLTELPMLTRLTTEMTEDQFHNFLVQATSNLKELHLYNNDWNCSCEQKWIKSWLLHLMTNKVLVKPHLVRCAFPDWNNGTLVHDLPLDSFCENPQKYKIIFIAIIVASAVSLIFIPLYMIHKFLYHIRLYLYHQFNLHPFDKDECIGEEMKFDAFITYSEQNSDWVENRLQVRLIPFRLMNHKTHFIPGRHIDQNILEAIKTSKRTIVVLTKEYVKSPYCMEEFKQSYNYWIEYMHKHRLIVLKHRDVNPKELEGVLELFLRKYEVINMDRNMWTKLKYAMPQTATR